MLILIHEWRKQQLNVGSKLHFFEKLLKAISFYAQSFLSEIFSCAITVVRYCQWFLPLNPGSYLPLTMALDVLANIIGFMG